MQAINGLQKTSKRRKPNECQQWHEIAKKKKGSAELNEKNGKIGKNLAEVLTPKSHLCDAHERATGTTKKTSTPRTIQRFADRTDIFGKKVTERRKQRFIKTIKRSLQIFTRTSPPALVQVTEARRCCACWTSWDAVRIQKNAATAQARAGKHVP